MLNILIVIGSIFGGDNLVFITELRKVLNIYPNYLLHVFRIRVITIIAFKVLSLILANTGNIYKKLFFY